MITGAIQRKRAIVDELIKMKLKNLVTEAANTL
jgi:hypothetical protein